ncbi:glucosyltransferase domain-containing protein [Pseudomonas sp. COR58]|uniref:Glucosyltransferase domain-containing protein n=1 Tax=Pseudomonas ekonensis TaxID=2842353 RepID=A0ABS6P8R7_9PSED|nr:glucosyltransferase domain-containing protein [Pseudomonas ekonensis]MBV4456870.1 glucosyltransferase domain-containing protein [Pseudomonas ekonensis]
MRMTDLVDRELSRHQVLRFFLFAAFLYALPLILADYPYIDDNWRSLAAGNAWAGQGRLFVDWLYQALTFSDAAPNIFPLPLLLATLTMALALTRLTFHLFPQPGLAACLVPLPLWYNPFLLQNLSYQYDGPATALSLAAVIFAITWRSGSRIRRWLAPVALLALAFGLYQISVNVFLGLCAVELIRAVQARLPWGDIGRLIGGKLAQLLLAVLIYGITALPFTDASRTQLLNGGASPLLQVGINLGRVAEKVALLFSGGYLGVSVALALCALLGAVGVGRCLAQRREPAWKAWLLGAACLLTLPLTVLLVPGMTLVFRDFNEGARTLMGFGTLLTLLAYLAYLGLAPLHRRLPLLLAVALLASLSLSFAYGRVLTMQKTFADSALHSLSQDIASRPALREAKRIYLSVTWSDRWLAAAGGSFRTLPVLRYLLNVDFYMLAENLPSAGITNVVAERERRNATHVGQMGYPPLVDSLYYRIYLIGDYGFIVMKEPPHGRSLKW